MRQRRVLLYHNLVVNERNLEIKKTKNKEIKNTISKLFCAMLKMSWNALFLKIAKLHATDVFSALTSLRRHWRYTVVKQVLWMRILQKRVIRKQIIGNIKRPYYLLLEMMVSTKMKSKHFSAKCPQMNSGKIRKGSFINTYAKFTEKLTFFIPWYVCVRVRIRVVRNGGFSENVASLLNKCSPKLVRNSIKLWQLKFLVCLPTCLKRDSEIVSSWFSTSQ